MSQVFEPPDAHTCSLCSFEKVTPPPGFTITSNLEYRLLIDKFSFKTKRMLNILSLYIYKAADEIVRNMCFFFFILSGTGFAIYCL